MPQPSDCFFLDLSYPFTGQTEFFSDLFQGHFLHPYSEEQLDNIPFAFGKRGQRPFYFACQRFVEQFFVGIGRIGVGQNIQQAVIFPVNKRSIDRYVPSGNTQGVVYFFFRKLQGLGQLFRGRSSFKLLFKLGKSLVDLVKGSYLVQRQANNT